MIASDEYSANSGGTTAGFITAVCGSLLHRSPSVQDIAAWTSIVESPNGRAVTASKIEASQEARNLTISSEYSSILRRAATTTDLATWFGASANAQNLELSIMATPEALTVASSCITAVLFGATLCLSRRHESWRA